MKTRILFTRELQPTHELLSQQHAFEYLKGEEIQLVSRLSCGYHFLPTVNDIATELELENLSAIQWQKSSIGRVYILAVTEETYKAIHNREHYSAALKNGVDQALKNAQAWFPPGDIFESTHGVRQYQYKLKSSEFDIIGLFEHTEEKLRITLSDRFEDSKFSKALINAVCDMACCGSHAEAKPEIIMTSEGPKSGSAKESTMELAAKLGVFASRNELTYDTENQIHQNNSSSLSKEEINLVEFKEESKKNCLTM